MHGTDKQEMVEGLVPIPHDGRKPDWLEDDALVTDELGPPMRTIGAHWAKWFDPTYSFCLSADHWAAPALYAGLTPWNPKLQGDGPPKDYDGGRVMVRLEDGEEYETPGGIWGETFSANVVIGYERSPRHRLAHAGPVGEVKRDHLIEIAATAYRPDLFSDDPVVAHRAASPFNVAGLRAGTKQKLAGVVDAIVAALASSPPPAPDKEADHA